MISTIFSLATSEKAGSAVPLTKGRFIVAQVLVLVRVKVFVQAVLTAEAGTVMPLL